MYRHCSLCDTQWTPYVHCSLCDTQWTPYVQTLFIMWHSMDTVCTLFIMWHSMDTVCTDTVHYVTLNTVTKHQYSTFITNVLSEFSSFSLKLQRDRAVWLVFIFGFRNVKTMRFLLNFKRERIFLLPTSVISVTFRTECVYCAVRTESYFIYNSG